VGIVAAALAVLIFYRVITRRLPENMARRLRNQALRARG
jgi:hypothetical protein